MANSSLNEILKTTEMRSNTPTGDERFKIGQNVKWQIYLPYKDD